MDENSVDQLEHDAANVMDQMHNASFQDYERIIRAVNQARKAEQAFYTAKIKARELLRNTIPY